ncbi:Uu.00g042400.m01.CDS01 [Anthostomella pinea]|uniref:Uu.00g042400.m01.CDS01 n=1 Tax=Anthostomella pinea TaxID=933095 RepID=A0AAI8VB93_9PEZI|nr:Uu.00g042400.m01.CDS01 [Anthostomella pinea]
MAYPSIGDFVPQLAGLSHQVPSSRPPSLGGQNFTHCCLLALNDSLTIPEEGNLSYASPSFVAPGVSIDTLTSSIQNEDDFACGARFQGSTTGAPAIKVPYTWCAAQCPGWEISRSNVRGQWVGPLVQFIVPSLAFCTNVPRTRKLRIPDVVFKARPRTVVGFCSYWVRLLGALVMVTVDTVVWLAICFAFAGPMLLSAVYEYALDRKVLEFMSVAPSTALPMRLRAQLLLAVVAGNIRMATLERSEDIGADGCRDGVVDDPENGNRKLVPGHRLVHNSIWKRIMVMVDDYETERAGGRSGVEVVSLPTKLTALLNSQASFGSTIGAPILFFVGSFVYTVVDSENNLGDNDTAHALAFGMWWMVIPYLAIIACAMLASNSPSTLEGLVYDGGNLALPDRYETTFWAQQLQKLKAYKPISIFMKQIEEYNPFETAFEGRFKTVKLWKRGLNKRQWVQEAINDYTASAPDDDRQDNSWIAPTELREALALNTQDCCYIAVGSLLLLLAPCLLAFLTSYNTPRAGLSCRSLTYLVYAVSQVCEMMLWTYASSLKIKHGTRWYEASPVAERVCWYGQVFVGFFAVFAAVGGTMMQLLGVYRSCACKVPATYWTSLRSPDAYIILSDNTADDILAARQWWTVTGSTAVGVVGIVCALAWWHQRRLRNVFRDEANILKEDEICSKEA